MKGRLPLFNSASNKNPHWLEDMMELWLRAEAWRMAALCNQTLRTAQQSAGATGIPGVDFEILPRLYQETQKDSPLRNFMVDVWLYRSIGRPDLFEPRREHSNTPKDFLIDLLQRNAVLKGKIPSPFKVFD